MAAETDERETLARVPPRPPPASAWADIAPGTLEASGLCFLI